MESEDDDRSFQANIWWCLSMFGWRWNFIALIPHSLLVPLGVGLWAIRRRIPEESNRFNFASVCNVRDWSCKLTVGVEHLSVYLQVVVCSAFAAFYYFNRNNALIV